MSVHRQVPVFVLTGFLGAGKTTLLNRALASPELARTAVIINEFGETGLDHLFVDARGEQIIELSNGCLCCTVRGQLVDTLLDLPVQGIDRIIIETTGLADPVPVLQAIIGHPQLSQTHMLAGVIVVADILNAGWQLERHKEARQQLALADQIVITKCDLVPEVQRHAMQAKLLQALQAINPAAVMEYSDNAPVAGLFGNWGLSRALGAVQAVAAEGHHHHHDVSRHGDTIRSATLRHEKAIPRRAVDAFCELMASAHGDHLLRMKGLVQVEGEAGPLMVHGVGGILHEPKQLEKWPDEDRNTRIVVIVDGMDVEFVERLFAGFANVPLVDAPDRAALSENPLAIAGLPLRRR